VEGGQIRLDELPAYLSRVLGFPDYGAMPMVHRPEKIDATTPAGAIPYPPVAQAHVASFHGNDQTLVNRAKNQYQHESTFSEQKACRKGCHSGFGVLVQDLSLGASGEDVEVNDIIMACGLLVLTALCSTSLASMAKFLRPYSRTSTGLPRRRKC
jgi:hypothetical protein